MWFKKKEAEGCSEELSKDKIIAEKYEQMSNCCKVISEAQSEEYRLGCGQSGGWKILAHTIKNADIDIDDIYTHIAELARKRKAQLDCDLSFLET